MHAESHRTIVATMLAALAFAGACRTAAPAVRFAPSGTDAAKLRSEFALTAAERAALTPDNLKALSQEQVDQIYTRLTAGPIPDGPFRGGLFFPRDRDGNARVADLPAPAPTLLAHVSTLKVERLARSLWRGKVFFRSQGILRNRIEDLAVLRLVTKDSLDIPKLTFDGQTTFLLFPARVACGESRLDATRPSIVIDYTEGPKIEGYREIPDKLVGPEGLNIRDEIRFVRPGFYLGRAYFGDRFGLNFTLLEPATAKATSSSSEPTEDCSGSRPSPMQ